jgi:Flp pilus assembly protein TadD
VRTGLGVVAASQNRLPQAREQFAEAARLDPKLAEARTNLAGALASSGDLAAAERSSARRLRWRLTSPRPRRPGQRAARPAEISGRTPGI